MTHHPRYNLPEAELPPGLETHDDYNGLWDYTEWEMLSNKVNGAYTFDEAWTCPDAVVMNQPCHRLGANFNQHASQTHTGDAHTISTSGPLSTQQPVRVVPEDQDADSTTASGPQRIRSVPRRRAEPPTDAIKETKQPAGASKSKGIAKTVADTGWSNHDDDGDGNVVDDASTGTEDLPPPVAPPPSREEIGREKNRIAARKCRKRRQAENKSLARKELGMKEVNKGLQQCVKELAEEVRCLKTMLLGHAGCDSQLIQQYIKKEAESFIDRTRRASVCGPGLSCSSGSITEPVISSRSPEQL